MQDLEGNFELRGTGAMVKECWNVIQHAAAWWHRTFYNKGRGFKNEQRPPLWPDNPKLVIKISR
jgi:hypothetical protein